LEKVGTLLGKPYKSGVLVGTYIENIGNLGNVFGKHIENMVGTQPKKISYFPPQKK